MSDWGRNCPVCGRHVRHNHVCHARRLAEPPVEGEAAAAWARRIKAELHAAKNPTGTAHVRPEQPHIDFGSEGL